VVVERQSKHAFFLIKKISDTKQAKLCISEKLA